MANIYKNAQFDLDSTGVVDVYIVPSNSRAIVQNIHTANVGAGNTEIKAFVYDNSVATAFQFAEHTVNAGNSRALVKSIHVYNEGAGDAVVTIKINSNNVDYFYNKKTIAADATHEFIINVLILQENDKLKMLSDITGPDVTISLLEINREDT